VPLRYLHSFPTRRSSDLLIGLSSCDDYPIDEDGLLITDRSECYVSNFELLDTDFQTVRTNNAVIDTVAQTIDVEVRWGTNLKKRSEEHTSELQSRFDLVC